jgi:hypothetical protein
MKRLDLTKIDWDLIKSEHENGLLWTKITKKFGIGKNVLNRAEREGFIKKIKHKIKHSDELRKHLSLKMSLYLRENPEKCVWKRSEKLKSVPCEILKKLFIENDISFVEEYKPLDNRFFSIDIAFPDKKIGIEVNGNQHYNRDGSLKEYYQKRKEEIEELGWKLFDIHYSNIYKKSFVSDLISGLKNEYYMGNIDYSFYIKQKKEVFKSKSRKEYTDCINEFNFKNIHSKRIEIISNSDIDFSKFGWAKRVSEITDLIPQKVKGWMSKFMPDFYESKCFKKTDRNGLSRARKYGSKSGYFDNMKDESIKFNKNRIQILTENNININDKKIVKKIMNLFGLTKSGATSWVRRYKKQMTI